MQVLLVVAAVLALASLAGAETRYERADAGLSVVIPVGWTVVREPLSPCTDPVQRIAVRGHGALVQIVERLHPQVRRFPKRPRRFALTGTPQFLGCCPPADGRGWFLTFRDGGRGFHAYVYLGAEKTRAEAIQVLDSLRVQPPR